MRSRSLRPWIVPFALLVGTACHNSGGGGGSQEPPATTLPEVGFGSDETQVVETDGVIAIPVELSEASNDTVEVPFAVTGSAEEGVHFELDADALQFAPGETVGSITVELLPGLALFQDDVELSLILGAPDGAEVGEIGEHVLRIANDGVHLEVEPNDSAPESEDLGGEVAPGRTGVILGEVVPGKTQAQFDVFQLRAEEDTLVNLTLTPESSGANVCLWIALDDPGGGLLDGVSGCQNGAGLAEEVQWPMIAGGSVGLVVFTELQGTPYELRIEGLEATEAMTSAPGPLEWTLGLTLLETQTALRRERTWIEVIGQGSLEASEGR